MPRPESHRTPLVSMRCETCRESALLHSHGDLLCFFHDDVEIMRYPSGFDEITLEGVEVDLLDGDAYDKVWAGRVVDPGDTCDEWEGR